MKIGKNIFAPRILAVITALLLACLCVIPAGATQKYKWVDDRNDLIGENCEKEIEASFEYIKNTYDYNVYFATVYSLGSKTATEYADDLYDSLFPINSTGILMLVSMEERDYAFSTSGAAIDLFNTDSRLINLELAVVALLRVNDFEGAAKTFAHLTQSCLEAVRRYEQDKDDIPNAWMNSYCETIDDYWVKRKMPEEYNSVSLRGIIKALSESHENTGGIYRLRQRLSQTLRVKISDSACGRCCRRLHMGRRNEIKDEHRKAAECGIELCATGQLQADAKLGSVPVQHRLKDGTRKG